VGDAAARRAFDGHADRAVATVEAATGRTIARSGRDSSGELANILLVADLVAILCTALRYIDGVVDREQLIAAIERIDSMPSATGGAPPYSPARAWGLP